MKINKNTRQQQQQQLKKCHIHTKCVASSQHTARKINEKSMQKVYTTQQSLSEKK